MSNAVLPTLLGLKWNVLRRYLWSTQEKRSVSGRSFTASNYTFPLRRYRLAYEFLRGGNGHTELQTMVGFFNARHGRFDSFLFLDPLDNAVAAQTFGMGDGARQQFQLVRPFGGFTEPVYAPFTSPAPTITVAGAAKVAGTDYAINGDGLVTFAAPPANGVALAWTGSYYWRCRFTSDEAEFDEFMYRLFEMRQLEFQTVRP